MRRLVLMPDYTADPLWDDQTGAMVRLGSLPISEDLKHRQVGLAVDLPSKDTRVHVRWEPGAQPELPSWFKK